MTLNILSNSAANRALTTLTMNGDEATKSVGKLASGSRVVHASDDAASYSVGTRLNTEARSLEVAVSNAGQAISVLQTADQSMGNLQEALTRMRQLATQAGSDNLSDTERAVLDIEFQKLGEEISRLTKDVKLNGVALLASEVIGANGTNPGAVSGFGLTEGGSVQNISIRGFDNRAVSLGGDGSAQMTIAHLGVTADADLLFTLTVAMDTNADGVIDAATERFQKFATVDGGLIKRFGADVGLATGVTIVFTNENADFSSASAISKFTRNNASVTLSLVPAESDVFPNGGGGLFDVNGGAGTAALAADTTGRSGLVEYDFKMGSGILADEDNINVKVGGVTLEQLGVTNATIATKRAADASSQAIDAALEFLVATRSDVGGAVSQIETATDNITIGVERQENARSRFLDLNVASEITRFTNRQVIYQSGISTMAQANQLTQNLLRLFA